MQFVVLNVEPEELSGLKTVLGIDVLTEGVAAVAENLNNLIAEVGNIKAVSDRVEAGIDRLVTALDETNLSGADRAAVDSALATLRGETAELSAAADRAAAKSPEPGEEDPEEPTDPENPDEPVQGARKKAKK